MRIRTVTVGVDGSPASRAALDWAVERARHIETVLRVVTVAAIRDADTATATRIREHCEQILSDAIDQVRAASPDLDVASSVLPGSPSAELVKITEEEADLLVIGTDKSSRARQLVYGTVPLRLAALAACPLVVIPRSAGNSGGPVQLAVGDDLPSQSAVDFAAGEAEARGVPLELVHVWEPVGNYPSPLYLTDYPWQQLEESARRLLDDAARRIRTTHPALTVSERLAEGPTIPRLVEAAADAQLLVVGRGGRGIFRDLIRLGSIAHDVLLNPPAPVAVVPASRRLDPVDDLDDTIPISSVR